MSALSEAVSLDERGFVLLCVFLFLVFPQEADSAAFSGRLLGSGAPVIIEQPANETADLGAVVQFKVVAGGGVLTYQWFKNDVPIANAVADTLVISNVSISDAAFYRVAVSNSNGTTLSSAASLAVLGPIVIKTQPLSQTVKLGAKSASFKVEALSQGSLNYKWFKDGIGIAGATNSTLTLTNIQRIDQGAYSVIAFNAAGNQLSDRALLTVDTQVAPLIFQQPTNQVVLAGQSVAFSVNADGQTPLFYQWMVNGRQILKATNSSLLLPVVQATDVGTYVVIITNRVGQVTSAGAVLTVNTPPAITTHPRDQTNAAGGNIVLSVVATGTAPLRYEWLKDGNPVANATNAALTIQRVQPIDAGVYRVTVLNAFGSASSSNALVVVTEPPVFITQPVSQSVLAGTNVAFSVTVSGRAPFFYQWMKNGAILGGATNPVLNLRNVQVSDAGNYNVTVSNIFAALPSMVASLRVDPAVSIRTQPQSRTVSAGTNVSFSISAVGAEPLSYQWFKDGEALAGGSSATLLLERVGLTNAGNYAAVVQNNFGSATSTVAVLTVNAPPLMTLQPEDVSAIAGSDIKFRAEAIGTSPLRIQWFKNSVALAGAVTNVLAIARIQATNAGLYYLVASNSFGAATSRTAALTVYLAPSFLAHPMNQLAAPGSEVRFEVRVSGTPPFTFQWFKDDQALVNGVESTLIVRQAQLADAGRYKVQVKNLYGTAESVEATLVIQAPPVIVRQPASQTIAVGADLNLAVEIIGRSPLNLQWFKNGIPIPGATSTILQLPRVTEANTGVYKVIVQNSDGRAESSEARIVVESPIAAKADLDGDLQPDLLFQDADGFLASWLMSGVRMRDAEFLNPSRVTPDWKIAATGDMNRDRKEDVIFQNADGRVAVWFMHGRQRLGGELIDLSIFQPMDWRLAGAVDFDRNTHLDLIFQHATGSLAIWFLQGTTVLRNEVVSLSPGERDWKVVGAGDFDGDGENDLTFQHADGTLAIWYMRGTAVLSADFLSPRNPGDRQWRVINVIDRNGDRVPDLLFQHGTHATMAVWLMRGRNMAESILVNPPAPGGSWSAVGR